MALPGVRVGPLDPESTAGFGQVSAQNSARQLIRLHRQLHPPALLRSLARPRDEAHSQAALENLGAVQSYVDGLTLENGDKVLPEGGRVNGAAVRGESATGRVLTFTYSLPSGRTGTWHAPYNRDVIPEVFDAGERFKASERAKREGLPLDYEGTRTEILERHNQELRRERDALRATLERGGDAPDATPDPSIDLRPQAAIAADLEEKGREVQELRERLARYEALEQAQGGNVNVAGVQETIRPEGGPEDGPGLSGGVAAEDPPFDGFESMKADDVNAYLKASERTDEERRAVLEYERTHANRKSVVSTAEQTTTSVE